MVEHKTITTGYTPRHLQSELHYSSTQYRFLVLNLHRRFGKTVFSINDQVDCLLRCEHRQPQGAYIAPTYGSAKRVAWDIYKQYFEKLPGVVFKEGDLQIQLPRPHKGDVVKIWLLGAENPESIRGMYLDYVILDEYASINPIIWSQVVRPALSDRKGRGTFIGTPQGENHFYDIYLAADSPDLKDWYARTITVDESKYVDADELISARKTMTEDEYNQEFLCFTANTQIATPLGHRFIQDIREDEVVFSHTGRARRVLSTNKRQYTGDLVNIKRAGWSDPIQCTPEHPIWVSRDGITEWVKAEDIKVGDFLVSPRTAQTSNFNLLDIRIIKLMAWYITEGSFGKTCASLALNPYNKNGVIDEVKALLDDLGVRYKTYKAETAFIVSIHDTKLADFLLINCGKTCYYKKIPFHLIKGYEEEFLLELIKGDGCELIDHYAYSTTSKTLARDVMLLSSFIGYRARACTHKARKEAYILGRKVTEHDSYDIRIYPKTVNRTESPIRLTRHYTMFKVMDLNRTHYTGPVYNFEVQTDNTYIADGVSVHNCSFSAAMTGAYYSKYLETAGEEGRICDVPHDSRFPVATFWDLGISDAMTIWFIQKRGDWFHVIDYMEHAGKGIEFYIRELNKKPYVYAKHHMPHDVKQRELVSGKSRLNSFEDLGLRPLIAVPKVKKKMDAVNAVRFILPLCRFDRMKCGDGIRALKNYQAEWDAKLKKFKDTPRHDWASHGADGFSCFALGQERSSFEANYSMMDHLPTQTVSDYNELDY